MVTGETITNTQIRKLARHFMRIDWHEKIGPRTRARAAKCGNALNDPNALIMQWPIHRELLRKAREWCAEMHNAWKAGQL